MAFGEAARVLRPDGRLAIGTFHPLHFERYWLKEFFPSLEAIDKARFPTPGGARLGADTPPASSASSSTG